MEPISTNPKFTQLKRRRIIAKDKNRSLDMEISNAASFVIFSVYYKYGQYDVEPCDDEIHLRKKLIKYIVHHLKYLAGHYSDDFDEDDPDVVHYCDADYENLTTLQLVAKTLEISECILQNQMGYGIVSVVANGYTHTLKK
jgi:hypothetical protein